MNLAHYVGALNLLGDESRLRLCVLLRGRELTVTDLVRVTGISQSRVSTHLARLREGGFVRDRREGQHAYYALCPEALPTGARGVLDEATAGDDATLARDQRRLHELDAERRGALPEAFVGEMERHYSPGRTWQSFAAGLAGLLRLGDVLDVGSGDGAAASALVPYCRSLTCVDASAPMVEAARRRLARHPAARALVADAHALPFAAASFDVAVVFHTLTYAEQPAKVLAECARVLRPGGRAVLLSLDKHAEAALTARYGERHAGFSPRSLRTLLTRAGLAVVTCEVASREARKPHFQVVLAIADKPPTAAHESPAAAHRARARTPKSQR